MTILDFWENEKRGAANDDEVIKVKNDENHLKSGKKSGILTNYLTFVQESCFCIFVVNLNPEIESQSRNS